MMELEDICKGKGGVELMKASAGSGKTHSLAREYIRLLLEPEEVDGRLVRDPHSYRHILAVTFTNKATGEMKSRIIKELNVLSHDASASAYRADLMKRCRFGSEAELSKASSDVLSCLLHDYGAFSVSTIDKFFQQTLRAFAREIGQVAEYQIELDRDTLVEESVDRVLDSLSQEDASLLKWLSRSSIEQIEDGKGYHLESILGEFAKGYISDTYREKSEALGMDPAKAFSEKNLSRLRDVCKKIVADYEKDLNAAVQKASQFFDAHEAVASGVKKGLDKIAAFKHSGTIEFDSIKVLRDGASDGSCCFLKKGKTLYGEDVFEAAARELRDVLAFEGRRLAERNTARILEGQVYVFRVAESLSKEFDALLKEKNVLSISDTNTILKDIIGGTEIPFIYEKLGVRFKHFLLDEFQDTSTVQWENFRPLLANSISEGCYNLVVGDVKQSIYRWRNTDWRIIDSRVGNELGRVVENPLRKNWRSARNIVEFNSDFFKELASRMDSQLDALSGSQEGEKGIIGRIYSDVGQEVSDAVGVPGSVSLTFCGPDVIEENVVNAVLAARDVNGFSLSDIAVIVRTNAQGGAVASALIDAGVNVVTNDSLRVSSGGAVRRLVARLYRYDDPTEKVKSFNAGEFDPSAIKGGGSIMSLSEEILRGIEIQPGDTPYVLAFLDLVRDFEQREGNSLSAFLKYWEEDGVRMSISSPDGSDAVTVITIHKVKGLDYPCVILPIPRSSPFMRSDLKSWESPSVDGTAFENVEKSLYHIGLSNKSADTLFSDNFIRERRMSFIDNANLWYVAMTRASQMMHIVSPFPPAKFAAGLPVTPDRSALWPEFNSISEALYAYVKVCGGGFESREPVLSEVGNDCAGEGDFSDVVDGEEIIESQGDGGADLECWIKGEDEMVWRKPDHGNAVCTATVKLPYVSYPSDGNRGRLKISDTSREFFFPEEIESDQAYDCRMHGTLVHSILENVNAIEDIPIAVGKALDDGKIGESDAQDLRKWLSDSMGDIADRGWFGRDCGAIRNERTVIDPVTGAESRPDRVLVNSLQGGVSRVEIIDYKTGAERKSYEDQVRSYVGLYRKMGYSDVAGFIWYIGKKVVEVRQ